MKKYLTSGLLIASLSLGFSGVALADSSNASVHAKFGQSMAAFQKNMERKIEKMQDKIDKEKEKLEKRFDKMFGGGFWNGTTTNATTTHAKSTPPKKDHPKKDETPFVLNIGGQGHIVLRGDIEGVASSSLSVRSWGGLWTGGIASSTKIISKNTNLADFKVGDYVGVQGKVSTTTNLLIDATIIRDRTE